ncbi:MAG: hypothetical protein ABIJ81_00835 [Patescibacteria group bacterium]
MSRHAISIKSQSGYVLVAVSLITTGLLFLAGFFLEQSTSEIKISKSENLATKTYYLAEAGAHEAIYKFKNDADWRAKFLSGTLVDETLTRSSVFDYSDAYTISATSVDASLADVTITATYDLGGQQTKRVIKTRLARANNSASSWEQSVFGGGTGGQQNGYITIERNCTVNGGTLHANQNFKVTSHSTLTVNDAALSSSNNIIINNQSSIILNNSTQTERTPSIGMPIIDFDSNSPTSLKNRADQVYSATDFTNLPEGTILDGITFVTGSANWQDKNLTINGVLAASDDIEIELSAGKTVAINSSSYGSGILGKDDVEIELNDASLILNGLLYATEQLEVETLGNANFTLIGGAIGWHLKIEGVDTGICSITYDGNLAYQPLDPVLNGSQSPIIDINHWEEQY